MENTTESVLSHAVASLRRFIRWIDYRTDTLRLEVLRGRARSGGSADEYARFAIRYWRKWTLYRYGVKEATK
jgi:hypothetical protein